jgi:hypothetical protein
MKRDWTRHTDEFEDLETIVATLGYDKDAWGNNTQRYFRK